MNTAIETPEDRYHRCERLAFFALRLVWPSQGAQKRAALKFGMDYEDFDQIARAELWRCCKGYIDQGGDGDKAFNAYVIKSIRFTVLDAMRRKGSIIKYSDDVKDRDPITSLDSIAPDSDGLDYYGMIDSGPSVEATVINRITLEEKISVLNENERNLIIYKLSGYSQKEIESLGYSVPRQDYLIRKAYMKLGIKHDRSARKNMFIDLYNAGKSQEEIMMALNIDKFAFRDYRKTYRSFLTAFQAAQ